MIIGIKIPQIMIRAQNAHAYVNAGFLFQFKLLDPLKRLNAISLCRICYGGINPDFVHATATEQILNGTTDLYSNGGLKKAIDSLKKELQPDWILPDASSEYRKNLAIALFYRFVLSTTPLADSALNPMVRSAAEPLQRGLSSGMQSFGTVPTEWPLTEPVKKYEGQIQTSGEAIYANDIQTGRTDQELWAAFVGATEIGHVIAKIDPSEVLVS